MSQSLVKYDKQEHYELIAKWYAAKGDTPVVNWLPDTTYLCFDDKHGFSGVGALLLTNSAVCFLEHIATNQELSETTQAKALRFIVLSLEQVAKNAGYKVILGLVPEDHFSLAEFYKRQGALLGSKLMRIAFKYFE
jgi:hypothetical protein